MAIVLFCDDGQTQETAQTICDSMGSVGLYSNPDDTTCKQYNSRIPLYLFSNQLTFLTILDMRNVGKATMRWLVHFITVLDRLSSIPICSIVQHHSHVKQHLLPPQLKQQLRLPKRLLKKLPRLLTPQQQRLHRVLLKMSVIPRML